MIVGKCISSLYILFLHFTCPGAKFQIGLLFTTSKCLLKEHLLLIPTVIISSFVIFEVIFVSADQLMS